MALGDFINALYILILICFVQIYLNLKNIETRTNYKGILNAITFYQSTHSHFMVLMYF